MSKRAKQLLILFLILIFPSLFYVILSGTDHDIVGLPYYGPKEVNASGDTIYHEVSNLSQFLQKNEQPVPDSLLNGKIKIVSFLENNEQSFRVMEQLKSTAERFQDKNDVLILTLYNQNETDREEINNILNTYKSGTKGWHFLITPETLTLQNFAREELFVSQETKLQNEMTAIVLLDDENRIRGYFDGLQYVETKELRNAVKALRFKKLRPVKKQSDEGK